jgi:hypothetical protein
VTHIFNLDICPHVVATLFSPTTPPIMASRFFHGGDSDSESSSSDEEELYSDHEGKAEESEEDSDEEVQDSDDDSSSDESGKGTGANRFLKPSGGGADDSDESEDEDRVTVVKSAKDKRLEEVEATIKLIDRVRQDEQTSREGQGIQRRTKSVHQGHFRSRGSCE